MKPTKRQHRWKTVLASCLAATVASLIAFNIPANAAPGDGPGTGGQGSITVHKLEQPSGDIGPSDGSKIDSSKQKPVSGVGFSVAAIKEINLKTPADWTRLRNLAVTLGQDKKPVITEKNAKNNLTLEQETAKTTGQDGIASFENLPADKAYVVWESAPLKNAVTVSQPVIVSIPYPGNGATGATTWNYNLHLYPKNALAGSGATKNGKVVGNKITYDITVPINSLGKDKEYKSLVITDKLSQGLQYDKGSVTFTDSNNKSIGFVTGDYTLSNSNGSVELRFTADGLKKINANIGGKLKLTLNVTATAAVNMENTATVIINDVPAKVMTPKDQNIDLFTGAHIVKVAKNRGAKNEVPLAGAGFAVYDNKSGKSCPAKPDESKLVSPKDYKSDAKGNTPNMVLAKGLYCVYETGVPAGYKGLTGPVTLEVKGENSFVKIINTQIGNDKGDLPALPLTGGWGSVALIGIGVLLSCGVVLLYIARRKRERA